MYQVIIVDDEPMAIQSIRTVIEKRSTDFAVMDVAENGQEALQKIRELHPDLVISDIKMPFLSGVELAAAVRKEFPEICFIIVSGYQDFEYAQSAVRSGVTDYLLKPVIPSAILKSLEFAKGQIRQIHYNEQNKILRALGNGETVDLERLKRYLPYENYYGAILRTNGLPRRFSLDKTREIYSDINEQYVVFGRDEMEALYLIPGELIQEDGFLHYLERIRGQQVVQGYTTLIYDTRVISPEQLQERIRELYQTLDQCSSVGITQSVNLAEEGGSRMAASAGLPGSENSHVKTSAGLPESRKNPAKNSADLRRKEEQILSTLEAVARTRKADQIQKEIRKSYDLLGQYQPPQIWLEHFTREVLAIMRENRLCKQSMTENEYQLNDAFFYATSIRMLTDSLVDVFLEFEQETTGSKVDSREYFEQIERWLNANLSKTISLQELCREFGISQTYMSRLFRKYSGNSYSQYLTELRMNRAKELFREDPAGFIKDVAAMVGYEDQFYFSRIFRSYTGKSPSEYLKDCMDR